MFRIMIEWVKVFKRKVATISNFIQLVDHCGPVGCSIKQCTKRVQIELLRPLVPLFEMDILDETAYFRPAV